MKVQTMRTATAVALILGATAAYAQQKPDDGKAATPGVQQNEPSARKGEAPTTQEKATEPKAGKGATQTEPKEKTTRGSAQSEPMDKGTKGTAQIEPKDKGVKGTTQTEPKEKASKGTQGKEPSSAPKSSEGTKGAAPKDSKARAPSTDQNKSTVSNGNRVQLSEQQRTTVHQTILKDRGVNRVANVNFTIKVGTRVPRELRLMALPASVISVVSGYRSYRYFVVNDQICIVDPTTYEIIDIIDVPGGQTAAREDRGGTERLALSDDERLIILGEIDMRDSSTLGLGSLTEGADVPRDTEVRVFPETIVQKVPKLRGYKFFTAENRIGIVHPETSKVQLVIEGRR